MSKRTQPQPTSLRRAVIYVRISKDRDNETSTESQADAARALCAAHGYQVVDVVVEAGKSAFGKYRNRRPGLAKVRRLVESGAADMMVVWKIDRAARNTKDLLGLVEWLRAHGAEFVSVTERIDTTAGYMAELLLTILAALAQMESAVKAERTAAWHEHRNGNGERKPMTPATRPPRGYVRPAPNRLAIDPVQGPVVQAAARSIVEGGTLSAAARLVGMRPAGLRSLLMSPTLAGLVEVHGHLVEGEWPALLDRPTWDNLQALFTDPTRRSNASGSVRRRWALSGIVRCGAHGEYMRTMGAKDRAPRLVCSADGCSRSIPYAKVEELVAERMLAALDDATWMEWRRRGRVAQIDPAVAEAERAQLMDMVRRRLVTLDEAEATLLEWEGAAEAAAAEPVELPDVESVRAAWPGFTADEMHLVFEATIESLTIGAAAGPGPRFDPERVSLTLVD